MNRKFSLFCPFEKKAFGLFYLSRIVICLSLLDFLSVIEIPWLILSYNPGFLSYSIFLSYNLSIPFLLNNILSFFLFFFF